MANRYLKDAVSEKIKPLDIERKQKIMERAIENPIPEPLAVFAMGLIDPETNQQIDAPSGSFGTAATKDVGTTNGTVPLIGAGDKIDVSLIPEIPSSNITYTAEGSPTIERLLSERFSDFYVSVMDFDGVVGDDINDDTVGIQAAMDYAKTVGKTTYFPRPQVNYRISVSLKYSQSGGGLLGENKGVIIRQITNGEHGIEVLGDATDGGLTRKFIIKNLYILGNGSSATGTGIRMADGTGAYNGNWSNIEDCRIEGFAGSGGYGLYSYYFDNFRVVGTEFYGNDTNVYLNGNSNSVTFENCANVSSVTRGWHFASGGKAVIISTDNGNGAQIVYNEGTVEFINSNFENPTGGNGVIESAVNGITILNKCTFLGNSSAIPPFYCNAVCTLLAEECNMAGFSAGTKFTSSLASAKQIIRGLTSYGSNRQSTFTISKGTYEYAPGPFDVVGDSSVPSAVLANRTMPFYIAARDGTNLNDRVVICVKDSDNNFSVQDILNRTARQTTNVSGTTQQMVVDTLYRANNAGLVTLTLPASAIIDQEVMVVGVGAGGWRIAQNASQVIRMGGVVSTSGTGGYVQSTNQFDVIRLKYTATNTWEAIFIVGEPATDTGARMVKTVPSGGTGVATLTGLVKGNGTSAFSAAVSGTDYAPASGFTTTEVTGTSANLAINTRVIANNAGLVTLTLPTTAALGSVIEVVGKGAGGWRIAQNASQIINASSGSTTSGVTGSISSQNRYDCTRIVCITANTDWVIQAGNGTLTFV